MPKSWVSSKGDQNNFTGLSLLKNFYSQFPYQLVITSIILNTGYVSVSKLSPSYLLSFSLLFFFYSHLPFSLSSTFYHSPCEICTDCLKLLFCFVFFYYNPLLIRYHCDLAMGYFQPTPHQPQGQNLLMSFYKKNKRFIK